jgi:hypothetical protein
MAKTSEARFAKWCRLGGPQLVNLADQVSSVFVPIFLENGFARVSIYMRDPADTVSVREIRLERACGEEIEGVTINFDKYRRPCFQVSVDRRRANGAKEWVRAANIVKRPKQYICFWGSPWWLPRPLWSPARSQSVVGRLTAIAPDMLTFLDDGQRSRYLRVTADAIYGKAYEIGDTRADA